MSSEPSRVVPDDHVALILLEDEESCFYLQIPLDVIGSLCLKPRKYLLFLGWCVLGVEGGLALEGDGGEINTDGDLDNGEVYYYVAATDLNPAQIVDLEVIKMKPNVSSESTHTCDAFRTNLLERDSRCPWTGVEPKYGTGLYIIPYERGSEWLRLIVQNRPRYSEDVEDLDDINNIRNGVFGFTMVHTAFDLRDIVILKTPNHILKSRDIPPCHVRNIPEDVCYPGRSRYTLQWLIPASEYLSNVIPNNSDATFKQRTRKPKPSDLLLHYNYGAAAVKHWGRGIEHLQNFANPPRPHVPVPAPAEASKAIHDRSVTTRKLEKARAGGGAGTGTSTAGAGTSGLVESEGKALWDEDDVMLFFWGNSRAAKERNLKSVDENTQRMEQWREGVP